jgi:hypothetical protein
MAGAGPMLDPRYLPSFSDVNAGNDKASPFFGGLGAGVHGLLGLGSSALEGVAKLEGADKVADVARGWADTQNRIAGRIRPDLDVAPWQQGGASVLPWAEYQLGKLAPTLAGYTAATLAAPEAAIPTAIARGLPTLLGGVAADAAPEAAAAAGKFVLGGGLFGGATGFGQAIQSADQQPGGATQSDAAQALAESPVYAAAGLLTPSFLKTALKSGGGNILARIASKGLEGSAVGAFQSGAMTALDQTFRPDLTARDKMNNIVDATVTGAAVGGLAGGLAGSFPGAHAIKRMDPNEVSTDFLNEATAGLDPDAQKQQQKLLTSTVYSDTAGRASPDANALLNGSNLLDYNTIANPKQGSLRWAKPYEQGSDAPFAAAPTEELHNIGEVATNYLMGLPEDHKFTERDIKVQRQLVLINEELSRRNETETSVAAQSAPAGAVEPSPSDSGAAGGAKAPAPAKSFKDTVADLTKGLRLPGRFLADIAGAKDANDLLSKVHDQIFEHQDERPTVQKLAQRLGLLDEQLNPTDTAQALGTRKAEQRAAAAPVDADPAFQQKWATLTDGTEDKVIQRLKPVNEAQAQRMVYDALTSNRGDPSEIGPAKGEVTDRLEKLAQDVGLLDENKKPTTLMANFSKQEIPLHESTTAAMDKGFKGAEVSQFDRGARTPIEAEAPKFDDLREAMAFMAGREWANPETLSEPRSLEEIKKLDLGDHFDAGQEVPETQRSQRWLNQAIDARYDPTVHPEANAQLKRLVAEGADARELDDAQRSFDQGRGILVDEPPERPRDPNVKPTIYGDTITPDPSLVGKTAAEVIRADAKRKQDAAQAGKAEQLLTARQAIVRDELQKSLKLALNNDDIKAGNYMHLRQALNAGEHEKVREALSNLGTKPYVHINGRDVATGRDHVAAADLLDRQNNSGGGAQTLMAHLKALGGPIGNMAARFEKYVPADVTVDIKTPDEIRAQIGDVELPAGAATPMGAYNPETRQIVLSTTMDHPSVALHEIVHAITSDHISNKTPIGREMIAMYDKFKKSGPASDYAFINAHEFMSEFLARQQVRDYVKNAQPTVFQKVWNAIRKMLGMPAKDYVERILKLAERAGANPIGRAEMNSPVILARMANDKVKEVVDGAEKLIRRDDALGIVRKTALGWATVHDIGQHWGKWFDPKRYGEEFAGMKNPVAEYETHLGQKQSIVARMAQMMTTARDSVQHLLRVDREAGETLVRMMRLSEFGIDPTKDWEHQADRVRLSGNKKLEAMHAEANKLYNDKLLRKGHAGVYQNLRDVNDVQMMSQIAATLHAQVSADTVAGPQLAHFASGPMDRFLDAQNNQDFTPATARQWWSNELQTQMNALDGFFRTSEKTASELGDSTKENRQRAEILNHMEPLRLRVKAIKQTLNQIEEAPYFHLGRFGNYFVGWHVTSQDALGKVADHLDALGFKGVISRESEKVNNYMRVENQQQQRALLEAIEKFNRANPGMIEPGHTLSGERTSEVIRNSMADQWFQRMIKDIEANEDITAEAKKVAINSLQELHLDLMPENSISRVMTHREGVPGYSPDMLRAFEHRANVGINALAGMVIAPKISHAFTDMRSLEKAAQRSDTGDVPVAQRNGMTNVIDELSRRERERPQWPESKLLDQLRAVNHAWFLGGSVSYGLVNLTQLGATLLPELGARHGFVKTAKTIGSVTPLAMKIVAAIAAEGKKVSISRAMDAVVTRGALDRALDVANHPENAKIAEFIMRVANSGELDIGGPSRELMRAAAGQQHGGVNATLRYASAIGYYTETASRLIAALSSYHLDGLKADSEKAADRAVYVLKETMWDYSQANQGREFGKMGILGRFTPLATAFMQYTAQLSGKLYRETYEAIKGETPEERAEARRFLLQHAVSMTMLAGTLGLPMVLALAATVDRLKDEFDDDGKPSDVRAAWRNMLSDTFGKDMGEVLSRGATRAGGIDISARVGEQDILPFSKMIADRRNFKDSIKDMQSRSWGAPTSMLANALKGGEAITNGDFLGGMQAMLPNALAAPVKAYQMSDKGFVDANGKVLPMKPGARDVLAQLLGFAPSAKAEYSEARQDQAVHKGLLTRQATVLRNSLVQSIINRDHDTARSALDQIKQFNSANPAYEIKGGDIEGALRRQAQSAAVAKLTGTPLGVANDDFDAQRLTRYANIDYRGQ